MIRHGGKIGKLHIPGLDKSAGRLARFDGHSKPAVCHWLDPALYIQADKNSFELFRVRIGISFLKITDGESIQPKFTVKIKFNRKSVTNRGVFDMRLGNAPEFLNNGIHERPEFD